jgi:tetratricopeptide (TPR) repeat protein
LAERSGNLTQFGNSLAAQGFTAWIAADLSTAGALSDQALELGLREGNPTILAFRYLLQLMVRYWRGDLTGAEQSFSIGLEFFQDPGFRKGLVGAAIAAFAYGSFTAWLLGHAKLARERLGQTIAAADPKNLHDLAFAGHHAAVLLNMMREYEQARTFGARALELSENHQFPNEAAMARCALGQALAQLRNPDEGIAVLDAGIASMLKSGQRLGVAHNTAALAAAQARAGVVAEALRTVGRALEDFDEPVFRPEALRTRGEILHTTGRVEAAKADFLESISLARKIGAKAWELRTTMSFTRLLAQQGHRDEARAMLAGIYYWFTEGFDTPDLMDAKALLEELAGTGVRPTGAHN